MSATQTINRIEVLEAKVLELNNKIESLLKQSAGEKQEDPKKEKKAKKSKEKTHEADEKPKKKRGMTGYLLYAKETRPIVKQELLDNGEENPKPTQVITEVAKRWKSLDDDEREQWNTRAKAESDEEEDASD